MGQFHQPRLADVVADRLRKDILSGRYREGDVIDVGTGVVGDFSVSTPAMREAIRVLENDGLLRTRRGRAGGVVVQLPTPQRIGEVIAMVLQARRVDPNDVNRALAHLEPICAAMCAERPDRHRTVVPALQRAVEAQLADLADQSTFMSNARAFHDAIVENCGSETMVVAVGALQAIWDAHASSLFTEDVSSLPAAEAQPRLRAAIADHERIVEAIAAGDPDAAVKALREHIALTTSHRPRRSDITVVDASLIRRYQDKITIRSRAKVNGHAE